MENSLSILSPQNDILSKKKLMKIKKLISAIRKSLLKMNPVLKTLDLDDKIILEAILRYDITTINKDIIKYSNNIFLG